MTMNLQLEKENDLINSVEGQHLPGKEQNDVKGLMVIFSKNKFLSSDIFKFFPNLKKLSVWYYSVENIYQGNFEGAQHLERIYINNNKIPQLTDNIFSGASNLEIIDMKLNGIKSISNQTFAGLTKLRSIYMSHNSLKFLPRDIFDDLINLRNVSFTGNSLESVDGDLFKNNLKITHLRLSNNHLSVIGSNLITNLKSLKLAKFYDNPCISSSLYSSVNINALSEKIAKCTESNKPEQKLVLTESEKKKDAAKIDSLSKLIEDLNKTIIGKDQDNRALKQDVEVLHQEVNTLNKKNRELFLSDMKQLQEIETLKQKVALLEQNAESNQQIMTKINEELQYYQNKIKKSHFAYKCFN